MSEIDVSVIIPVFNAGPWFGDCLRSIFTQKHDLRLEVSIFLDSCTDDSKSVWEKWLPSFEKSGIKMTLTEENNKISKGAGYSKNMATQRSSGQYLCFIDADDIMTPYRIQRQYEMAVMNQNAIIGSKFVRTPVDSTLRYARWANSLNEEQLNLQIYTSHGPTIIMPTWFCHRNVYDRIGGFSEYSNVTPEDLIFFFDHLKSGGKICRCEEELLIYRYHLNSTTFSIHQDIIWNIRIAELEERVLSSWENFTIWNAGKKGRKFYRTLSDKGKMKVSCFCDVDIKKIGTFYTYEESKKIPKPKIPIVHFKNTKPPFIICMKLDLTGGNFEDNLASLQLEEGKDYHHFN